MFGISFFISIATFKGFAGFKNTSTTALWIIYILWPLVCAVVYIVSQLVLVFRTLEDRWPIGDIVFGTAFFAVAQILLFAFSATICDAIKHYIDGLFFFTLSMLLSVMMVYKYWDSITVRRNRFTFFGRAWLTRLCSARIWSSPWVRKPPCGRSRTRCLARTRTRTSRTPRATTMVRRRAWLGASAGSSSTRRGTEGVGTRRRGRIGTEY